jgi:hypothetical protein
VGFEFLWLSPWRLQSSGTLRRVVSQTLQPFRKKSLFSSAGYLKTVAVHSSETSVIFYITMRHTLNRYSSASITCGCCTIVQQSDWVWLEWKALFMLLLSNGNRMLLSGMSGGVHWWTGTALQAGTLGVRFPMVSLEFFVDINLSEALWLLGRLSLW